ncbi:putative protein phosphatase 2C 55 [Dorcoceras hygrometricum]|uniref:Protein phosphatase n=1 Tax=Dorcoceras hygrometricum TaxID=472368 RepID=A0A2Z7DE58_9LAMI|nr:putative protein phosphatase 2C 55 [Dorcoceras hygrometricum]
MSKSVSGSVDVKMIAGACYIPKNDQEKTMGSDSHFIEEEVQAIGVADGVGAGEFARALMSKAAKEAKKHCLPNPYVVPKQVLRHAYFQSGKSSGSCTACIVALDENTLKAVVVGDSGFLVIRGGKVVYKSPVQLTEEFDCSYQLVAGTARGLDVAAELKLQMEAGDVIVVGTDGLFDNLFPEEIEAMVKVSLQRDDQPNVLAESLAKAALEKSLDTNCKSPYVAAAQAAGLVYTGGKPDDITVVAGYVQPYSKAKVNEFSSGTDWFHQMLKYRQKNAYIDPRKKYEYYESILNPHGQLRGLW